ncbi:prepilin peptidase [Roseovarius sp. CAU 1744]|uniref:prepilin peptidase n=1 Tax=Roseovarius sp. CAU 1744 TaxID=3140368 RepID=UPI00325AE555
MALEITSTEALWFLPFVLPICVWVAWTDLSLMLIRNKAVVTLVAVFLVVGLIALPLPEYPWRLVTMFIVLLIGIAINAAGLAGAGDAKFIAAAAPFIDPGDAVILCMLFAANLVAAVTAHRIAKNTGLRNLAPNWESWSRPEKFPMGFSLGGTLAIYLILGVMYGQ